jgi:hypothetical protein
MKTTLWRHLILLFLACSMPSAQGEPPSARIHVSAGDHHRKDAIVSFHLPLEARQSVAVEGPDGSWMPLQVDEQGKATFILKNLGRGENRIFTLSSRERAAGKIEAGREGSKIRFTTGDRVLLEYQAEPGPLPRPEIKEILKRGGYLHPIFSPSGKLVSDDFPPQHLHHHGVWFAWTRTEFEGRQPDFWNMGQGRGRVEFVSLDRHWSGPVFAGLKARHRSVDMTAADFRVALVEEWETLVYAPLEGKQRYHLFDLTVTQRSAGSSSLRLPQYHYGGLGARGHQAWNGAENAFFLTSEGETDRDKGNSTRGRWCYMGGMVEGEQTGMVILGHPANFRAPQPMRLHPNEPFFCFAPAQLGDWEINPGKPYVSRYRFVVLDGAPDAAEIDRLWNDYAFPPEIRVELSNR